jgi:hypothetical protein
MAFKSWIGPDFSAASQAKTLFGAGFSLQFRHLKILFFKGVNNLVFKSD